jgi:hypothetical protein
VNSLRTRRYYLVSIYPGDGSIWGLVEEPQHHDATMSRSTRRVIGLPRSLSAQCGRPAGPEPQIALGPPADVLSRPMSDNFPTAGSMIKQEFLCLLAPYMQT